MPRLIVSLLLIIFSMSIHAGVDASFPTTQTPAGPGDFYWQMTHRGLMADTRLQYAFGLLIDTEAALVSAGATGTLVHASPEVARFIDEQSTSEARLLLAASGFANPGQDMVQTRPCRYWAPETGQAPAVAKALAAEVERALRAMGVEGRPCEAAAASTEADLIVWPFGFDSAAVSPSPRPDVDSFIAPSGEQPPPGSKNDVSPPVTGSGGLAATKP